jgi:hypothetical protein
MKDLSKLPKGFESAVSSGCLPNMGIDGECRFCKRGKKRLTPTLKHPRIWCSYVGRTMHPYMVCPYFEKTLKGENMKTIGTNMKKEDFDYQEKIQDKICYNCNFMQVKNPCMTEESLHCHIFQEDVPEFASCCLWQQHNPESLPL